jgi:tetratricopeptide (TPR) repeat protein
MDRGALLAGRFEIREQVGRGGMSTVYRAWDRRSAHDVALKLLGARFGHEAERFSREGAALASIRHPGIVRYVAHGRDGDAAWLAMEWLEGEDLAARLRRGPLPLHEALALTARIAAALGAAHDAGVVHRDVKPSNVFLLHGRPERAKILDFGVARFGDRDGLTAPGIVFGTLGYMSPEQARGERVIDPRADVFALGCVLFECITGRPLFAGAQATAVLAKVVFEDAPRLRSIRTDVPEVLDRLVSRMLAKVPSSRPSDGRALATEVEAVAHALSSTAPPSVRASIPARSVGIGVGEQRLVTVILATSAGSKLAEVPKETSAKAGETEPPAAVDGAHEQGVVTISLSTAEHETASERLRRIRRAVEPFAAEIELLRNGALVATLVGKGDAAELVTRAARAALSIRRESPEDRIVVATGRGILGGRLPVGEAIDKAARLQRAAPSTPPGAAVAAELRQEAPAQARSAPLHASHVTGPPIVLDDVTGTLLESSFQIERAGSVLEPSTGASVATFVLRGERAEDGDVRTLLGRPVPCVGRDRELSLLRMYLEEAISEPVARVVLVTAPPGLGKSRLLQETLRSARSGHPDLEVWRARGDPIGAGSPFAIVAQLVRAAANLRDGEPLETRREKLRARVARHVPTKHAARVAEFLGELVGAKFPDDESLPLRAARQDAILMGDQIQAAWEDLIDAEAAAHPLLIVVEDLHWGDLPSVQFLDAALRSARERPLLVIAAARPEIHDLFPRLWTGRGLQEIRLGELTRRAAERMAREVLGDGCPPSTIAALVERAAGNPFYLEELLRAAAEGAKTDAASSRALLQGAPRTVVAMVQARLERLEPEARRLLRAASVFGQVFWHRGVVALLGDGEADQTTAWLAEMVRREVIVRRADAKFHAEEEYAFRHALVRDAAYATLTEEDARVGHGLAAAWLASVGESDPMTMAEHLERGGEANAAIVWYRRAAEHALEGNDFEAAVARVERAVACGASGETLGRLRVVQAEAHRWRGELAGAEACSMDAMRLLPRTSPLWFHAASDLALASGRRGKPAQVAVVGQLLLDLGRDRPISGPHAIAATRASVQLLLSGRGDLAGGLVEQLERVDDQILRGNPAIAARIQVARYYRAICGGDPGSGIEYARIAAELFERAGDLRNACVQRGDLAYAQLELGAYDQARRTLEDVIARSERLGRLHYAGAAAKHNLGLVLARLGAFDQAFEVESAALEAFRTKGDKRMEGRSRIFLAEILLLQKELSAAAAEAERAIAVLSVAPPAKAHALALAAQIDLARDDVPRAVTRAAEADALLQELGVLDEGEGLVRLTWGEALRAAGRIGEAREALATARSRLLERAARIRDPELRRSFLERVPENARTLALARRLCDAA